MRSRAGRLPESPAPPTAQAPSCGRSIQPQPQSSLTAKATSSREEGLGTRGGGGRRTPAGWLHCGNWSPPGSSSRQCPQGAERGVGAARRAPEGRLQGGGYARDDLPVGPLPAAPAKRGFLGVPEQGIMGGPFCLNKPQFASSWAQHEPPGGARCGGGVCMSPGQWGTRDHEMGREESCEDGP